MLLYHAFPRGFKNKKKKPRANEIGVEQLKMIKEYGLLLTPESFSIPENQHAARCEDDPPQEEFLQTRACFTLVEREELWRGWRGTDSETRRGADSEDSETHFKLFGDFAIGLKSSDARRLGAVPVFYVYEVFGPGAESKDDINLTRWILFNLRELRSLCIALARLEAKANIPNTLSLSVEELDVIGHELRGDRKVKQRIEKVEPEKAREAVELLDTVRGPAWCLVDLIDITLNLFQMADLRRGQTGQTDPTKVQHEQHKFYQQREWRIVQHFNPSLRCQRLDPKFEILDGDVALSRREREEICGRLLDVNPEFFKKENRLNGSAILRGTRDYGDAKAKDFFDFVEEIICPREMADVVEEIICPRDTEDKVKQLDERGGFRPREIEGHKAHVVFVRRNGDEPTDCQAAPRRGSGGSGNGRLRWLRSAFGRKGWCCR